MPLWHRRVDKFLSTHTEASSVQVSRGGLLLFSLDVVVFIGIQECFAVSIDEKKQT